MAGGTAHDVGEGILGVLEIALNLVMPFRRRTRCHWGMSAQQAAAAHAGDDYVPSPAWSWSHAVEIEAPAERVWPWVAQLGQNKAGFYSYQWLENLAGCRIDNANSIHPEWTQLRVGEAFHLHPEAPPLRIRALQPGRYFVAYGTFDPTANTPFVVDPERAVRASWLFQVDGLGARRARVLSRHRVAYGADLLMRLAYGAWLVEPIGFVMDRRMLTGIKRRAERGERELAPLAAGSGAG